MGIYKKLLEKTKNSLDLHWWLGYERITEGPWTWVTQLKINGERDKARVVFKEGRGEINLLLFKIPKSGGYVSIELFGVKHKENITYEESVELMAAIRDLKKRREAQHIEEVNTILSGVLDG